MKIKWIIKSASFVCITCLTYFTSSCTQDIFDKENEPDSENKSEIVFFRVSINPDSGTRAYGNYESSTDYYDEMTSEDGQDYENVIEKVVVILGDPETNTVIDTFEISGDNLSGGKDDEWRYTATGRTTTDNLLTFMNGETNKDADVYVICNPAGSFKVPSNGERVQQVLTASSKEELDSYGSKALTRDGSEVKDYHFLMTNGDYANSNEDNEKNRYKVNVSLYSLKNGLYTEDNPLKPAYEIPVQRALARIDLLDDEQYFYLDSSGNPLGGRVNNDGPANWKTSIMLEYIGLININKKFNLFKETGLSDTDKGFFWSEMNSSGSSSRYVFDPRYSSKLNLLSETVNYELFSEYYLDHYTEPFLFTKWENYDNKGANIDDGDDSNNLRYGDVFTYFNIGPGQASNLITLDDGYKIRRYCTPNTISEAQNQKAGITTGMVFVCRLNFKNGMGFGVDPGYETTIYEWNGHIYGTNRSLQEAARNPSTDFDKAMKEAYDKAWKDYELLDKTDAETTQDQEWKDSQNQSWNTSHDLENNLCYQYLKKRPSKVLAKTLTENGFSIYTPYDLQGDGSLEYMCYYIIWIKHNDNENPAVMGPMEFGVVRNNIYKIHVKNITALGHPLPDNEIADYPVDAHPILPWDDDETVSKYISIGCKVLDWRVKSNKEITLTKSEKN